MKTAEIPDQYQIITLPEKWGYGYWLTKFQDQKELTMHRFDTYRHRHGLSLPEHTPPVSPLLEGYLGRLSSNLITQGQDIMQEYPNSAIVIAAITNHDPDQKDVFAACRKRLQTERIALPYYRKTDTGLLVEMEQPFLLALRQLGPLFAFGTMSHPEGISLIIRDGEKFNEIPSLAKQGNLAASFHISELGENLDDLLKAHLQEIAEAKAAAAKEAADRKAAEEAKKNAEVSS